MYSRALFGILIALVLVPSIASAQVVRIADDRGGRIGTYVDKYQNLRNSGDQVVIDGLCASACTIVLGAIPPERIVVTKRAIFGFHAAWDYGPRGQAVTNPEATNMLYAMYPSPVRAWISRHGGLKSKMIFLRGTTLARMGYRITPVHVPVYASAAYR